MNDIQNELKALINNAHELKDEHIKKLAEIILEQKDFCVKYNVDSVKAQFLATLYIEDNIPQFRNILLFDKLLDVSDKRYVPLICETPEDLKFNINPLCPEVNSLSIVDLSILKY